LSWLFSNPKKNSTYDFEREVEKLLETFSRKQTVYFAGLCAIRALPFLCATHKDFSFWKDTEKQKHLYALFNAIDTNLKHQNSAAIYAATRAAADAADAATRAADVGKRALLKDLIFKDLELIKTNKLNLLNNDVDGVYGWVWRNFQEALSAAGCGYWAKLYADLFTNRFVVDEKELEQRLNVPPEIKAQGAAKVGEYLTRLSLGKVERLDEARIIILGDAGAGKTSLARKLQKITSPMPKVEERTVGVDVLNWPLPKDQKGNSMNVHIWDFAGQTVTHAAHRCFMSSRCLYIYVFNGRVERGNDPEYWLEQIKMHGGDSKVLFLINEKDGERVLDIPKKSLKEEYPSIVDYYHVDIGNEKDLTELEKFRQTVMDCVRSEPSWNSQNISEDAYRVKAELNSRFKDGQVDLISRENFYDIARNQKVPEKDWDSVLDDLRVLGICLWYEDKKMKLDNYVLNPEWITNGIYKIIQWGRIKGKYELSIDDGKEIFVEQKDQQRYLDKMKFLFDLMTIYELAYFKKGSSKEIVIPILMPSDRPDGLAHFLDNDSLTRVLLLKKPCHLTLFQD